MAVVREHLVVGGEIVEQGGGMGGDDDGAPPTIPGMRVHRDGDIDAVSGTPDLEAIERNAARLKAAKSKAAKAAPKAKAQSGDHITDRRRCLELAAASGETDPTEVLAIAGRYLGFLLEEELLP